MDSRRRDAWILFAALFLFHAAAGVAAPLLFRLRAVLGASYPEIGWVNAAFGLARLLADAPAGWLVRGRSPSLLVLLGMGILGVGNLLAALAGSVYGVIAGRAVAGFGYSAAVIGTLALLAARATPTTRARIFSLYESLIVAGLAASTGVAGLAAEQLGWRSGFFVGALLAALALAAAMRALGRGTLASPALPAPPPTAPPLPAVPSGRARGRAVSIVLLIAFILSYGWTGLFYTIYPLYGGEHLRLGSAAVGAAMSTGYAADLVLLFPYGFLADRYGRRGLLLGGILLITVGALTLPFSGSGLTYGGVSVLIGAGFACWGLPPALLTDWVSPQYRGPILAVYRFMVDLGFVLGPWTLTVALARGGFPAAAWLVAGLTVASALGVLVLREDAVSAD